MKIKAKCKICGAEYIKTNGKSMYCSDECKKEATRRRYQKNREKILAQTRAWREAHPDYQKEWDKKHPHYGRDRSRKQRGTIIYERKCVICGKTFTTPFPQAITCGSEECKEENKRRKWRQRARTSEEEHEYYIRRKYGSEDAYAEYLNVVKLKKLRNIEKRAEQKRREKEARKIHGTCCVCGKPFETFNPKQKTCSKECGKKLEYANKSNRIPKEQIIDKDITLEALYRRDSGVCYLCGEKCDWDDKQYGHVGPKYPTIDHLIPISRGGLHSWDNVRLAHFECNCNKSNDLPDNIDELIPEDAYKYKKEPVNQRKQTAQYSKNGDLINVYKSTAEASRQTGLKSKQIQNCARGECASYGGYVWRYVG